jgi:site-specific DNA recombinase
MSTTSGYGRQSQGSDRSIDQQHDSYLARCAAEGWEAGPWLSDRVSASRYATKVRDDWPALMRQLPDLDIVWLWESSRGSRLLSEWALFLEACQKYRVKIYIETHERLYDPRNGRDEKQLNEDGVDSVYESSKVSSRVTRDNLNAAQNGKPHGWVAYGYKRTYTGEGAKRKMTGQVPDPDTALVVREIYARLRAGESLRRIANDLNERGIPSSRNAQWDERKIRQLALSPQYTALRIHMPVAGGVRARTIGNGVTTTEGDWERLVDRETFYRVHALLTDPARKTTKPGRARHLLSRIGHCGVCGGQLTCIDRKTRQRDGTGRMQDSGQREGCYKCADKSCVRVAEADLDRFATGVIIAWLSRPENYAAFSKDDSAELATVRADLAEQRGRRDEIAAALADGSLPMAVGVKAAQGLEGTITALEARERALSTPGILTDLIPPGADVASGWVLATLEARRELCRMVFAPGRAGTLLLGKREGGKLSAATRVRFDAAAL